jgi:hypothetical protein
MDLRHLVVEGDALVEQRLVGGEDAADDVGPRHCADVGQLLVPKRVLEVAGCAIWWSNWTVSKSEIPRPRGGGILRARAPAKDDIRQSEPRAAHAWAPPTARYG